MDKLIDYLVLYLYYLNNDCGLKVSVHFQSDIVYSLPGKVFSELIRYNSHDNPYCMCVKKNDHSKCMCYQKNLIKSITEPIRAACYAGVCEYVFPVRKDGVSVGYVAVSGYRTGEWKNTFADKSLWKNHLNDCEIPVGLCNATIPPLVIMLEKMLASYNVSTKNEFNALVQFLSEYHNNITLDDICSYFGRSKSYISHMFNKESGMTLRAFCNELKLQDAKKLLELTDKPVTEIAFDTGFNDTSYFISLFRKKYGASPLRYRNRSKS